MKKRMMIKYENCEMKNKPRWSPSTPSTTEMETTAPEDVPSKDVMESTTIPQFDKIEENIYLFDRYVHCLNINDTMFVL